MSEIEVFEQLCVASSTADLERLARRLETHLEAIEEAELTEAGIDVALATQVVAVLQALLASAPEMTHLQRARLRGALEYFLLTKDADDDLHSKVGLLDDARIVNLVSEESGRADLRIDLS